MTEVQPQRKLSRGQRINLRRQKAEAKRQAVQKPRRLVDKAKYPQARISSWGKACPHCRGDYRPGTDKSRQAMAEDGEFTIVTCSNPKCRKQYRL